MDKRKSYILLLAVWLLGLPGNASAASRYGASFLEIGVGARALSMGGAFGAVGGDATAFYWNPSGLALVERPQLSGMYGPQFGSIRDPMGNYHVLSAVLPLPGNAAAGVAWIRLAVDEIPVYGVLEGDSYWDRLHDIELRPSGDPEGYIQDTEDALFFTFALENKVRLDLGWEYRELGISIPVGINIKWIRQSLGEGEASGLGIDLGAQVRIPMNDLFGSDPLGMLAFGIHLQDLTRTTLTWNTRHQDPVPSNLKWGFSYSQPLHWMKSALLLVYERDTRWEGQHHWGIEWGGDLFALRIGMNGDRLTCGAGLCVWKATIDYAFVSHELDGLHRVSCALEF